jgi:hypothetical protein
VDELNNTLSEAQVQAALSGHIPPAVSSAAFDAAFKCGKT